MNNFKEDVINTLGCEIKKTNFKLVDHGFKDYAMFIKRYNSEIGLYVKCVDTRIRNHNGNVTVEFWIAPIQLPDDTITSLNIGIKISVLSEFMINDEMMIQVGKKVNEISKNIDSLVKVVSDECDKPYFENRRTKIFKIMKKLYSKISKCDELKDEFSNIQKQMKLALGKSKEVKKVYGYCSKFINGIPDDFFEKDLLDYGKERLGNWLAEEIYVQCLFDVQ